MHREDRARARADRDLFGVEIHRIGVDVDEHRTQPGERDDVGRRREGVRRYEHLVAGLETEREHREMERCGTRRDGDGVARLARAGELGFELGHARAHRELAALDHLRERVELVAPEVGPR